MMLNRTEFLDHVDPFIQWIQTYFENIENYPVKSQVAPGSIKNQLPESPPLHGESIDSLMRDVDNIIMPGITHWQHPNYHAYFTANASVESLYGEMITSAIAAQCMIWETSPAAAELEERDCSLRVEAPEPFLLREWIFLSSHTSENCERR